MKYEDLVNKLGRPLTDEEFWQTEEFKKMYQGGKTYGVEGLAIALKQWKRKDPRVN